MGKIQLRAKSRLVAARYSSINDVLNHSKSIRVEKYPGHDPVIEIHLNSGDVVLISAEDESGRDLEWGYGDEVDGPD